MNSMFWVSLYLSTGGYREGLSALPCTPPALNCCSAQLLPPRAAAAGEMPQNWMAQAESGRSDSCKVPPPGHLACNLATAPFNCFYMLLEPLHITAIKISQI